MYRSRQNAAMSIESTLEPKNGFHPIYKTLITALPQLPAETSLLLFYFLQPTFIIDTYQLESLRRENRLVSPSHDNIKLAVLASRDLEKPVQARTEWGNVLLTILCPTNGTLHVELPLHLRYQPPTFGGSPYVRMIAPTPTLLFSIPAKVKTPHELKLLPPRCLTSKLDPKVIDLFLTLNTLYWNPETTIKTSTGRCPDFNHITQGNTTIEIPTGDRGDLTWLEPLQTLFVWLACLYICRKVWTVRQTKDKLA